MINVSQANKVRDLIIKKMGNSNECKLEDKDTKETFFIQSTDNGHTYSLYRGCDLEIGDVPLMSIVNSLCSLHDELTKEVRKIHIGYWGGTADVHVINDLRSIPQGCRYICSTDSGDLDIYETDDGVVYGVRA